MINGDPGNLYWEAPSDSPGGGGYCAREQIDAAFNFLSSLSLSLHIV